MTAAALALGAAIGLVMGGLGGGGSVLTVPVLVFVLGLSAQEATTGSLVIVGVTAAAATLGSARSGRTRWRSGALVAAFGVPASALGSYLNSRVDPEVLLLSFAGVLLLAAAGMLLRPASAETQPPMPHRRTLAGAVLRLGPAGAGIGFLTGFLGVGGGFVIVPVLVVALGMAMPEAIATSLLVIALHSGVALLARVGADAFAWEVIVPFTATAVLGALAGRRLTDRVPAEVLTRVFGVLLLAVASYTVVQVATG